MCAISTPRRLVFSTLTFWHYQYYSDIFHYSFSRLVVGLFSSFYHSDKFLQSTSRPGRHSRITKLPLPCIHLLGDHDSHVPHHSFLDKNKTSYSILRHPMTTHPHPYHRHRHCRHHHHLLPMTLQPSLKEKICSTLV